MKLITCVAATCMAVLSCSLARAQLVPERLYNGIGRPLPARVTRPEAAEGDLTVRLLRPTSVEKGLYDVVAEAAAAEGRVDLSTMFPKLWNNDHPTLLYAQLFVGPDAVGSAVVLQPMLTPDRAHLMAQQVAVDPKTGQRVVIPQITQDPTKGQPMFESEQVQLLRAAGQAAPPREVIYSGIRAYVDQHVVLDTSLGEIELLLRPDAAPNTAFNFRQLVEGGFYTDIIFHRIVPHTPAGKPFVIQVGDPTGGGSGGPGYQIDLEPSTLPHGFGVISMARSSDPDSNGSQVFICLSRAGTEFLDGRYTSFGQAVSGADVIKAIAATPVDQAGRAEDPPILRSAKLIDAPPIGTGPLPLAEPTEKPVER